MTYVLWRCLQISEGTIEECRSRFAYDSGRDTSSILKVGKGHHREKLPLCKKYLKSFGKGPHIQSQLATIFVIAAATTTALLILSGRNCVFFVFFPKCLIDWSYPPPTYFIL